MSRKSVKKIVEEVKIYVLATFNNTKVTATSPNGDVLSWSSAGKCGFKGSRKATPFAGGAAAEEVVLKVVNENKSKTAVIMTSGPGPGKEGALRSIASKIKVKSITDNTPIPHNGCKKRKRRRV